MVIKKPKWIKAFRFWGHNPDDNFQNRRNLAMTSAVYSLAIWPNWLLWLHIYHGLEIDVIKAMLTYVGTLAGTSIGMYLWSAFTTPKPPEKKTKTRKKV